MQGRGAATVRRRAVVVAVTLLCAVLLVLPAAGNSRALAAPSACSSVWFVTLKSSSPDFGRVDENGGFITTGVLPAPSAAFAVSAADPAVGWFVGYDATGAPDGVLRRLDLSNSATSAVSPPLPMFRSNRLASAPDGSLWSLSADGHLWSARVVAGSVTLIADHGRIPAAVRADGPGGDIAFDGLGNLWLITYSGVLYELGEPDLNAPGTALKQVGSSGLTRASGLAFAADGTLLATSGGATGTVYRVDPANAVAVPASSTGAAGPAWVGDLASCSFGRPQVSATESVTPASGVLPGSILTYTLRIANGGSVPSIATLVRNTVPRYTSYVAGSTRLNSAPVPDGPAGFPLATGLTVNSPGAAAGLVAAGGSAIVTFHLRVAASLPTDVRRIADQGAVFFDGGPAHGVLTDDPSTAEPGDPTIASLRPHSPLPPLLQVTKSADHALARPGDRVRYTIDVLNTGGSAFTAADPARVVDDLGPMSADVRYDNDATASGGSMLTFAGTTLSWVGALAPGQAVRLSYSVTVRGDAPDGRLVNTVRSNSGNCSDGGNARCTAVVALTGSIAVPTDTTVGSGLAGPVVRGQSVAFWIVVRNTTDGPVQASVDRNVSCLGAGGVIGQSVPATAEQPSLLGGALRWAGPLAAGQSVRLGFSVTVIDPTVGSCLRSMVTQPSLADRLAATGPAEVLRAGLLASLLTIVGGVACALGRPRLH